MMMAGLTGVDDLPDDAPISSSRDKPPERRAFGQTRRPATEIIQEDRPGLAALLTRHRSNCDNARDRQITIVLYLKVIPAVTLSN